MTLVIFVLVVAEVLLLMHWHHKYEDACAVAKRYAAEKETLQKEHDFLKESVASWTTKPVYALLSDQQITAIGKTVGEYIKEPKWLN